MEKALEIRNISKEFKQSKRTIHALKKVSLEINKGEIFGLLGPNGAGKSTLLNIVTTIVTQNSGEVLIFGVDPTKDKTILRQMSSASGDARFHWVLRVKDILKFYSMAYEMPNDKAKKRIDELMKFFGLDKIENQRFDSLSTGQRMRLVFAKSLLNDPKLILLDEPTLGLDPNIAEKLRKEIRRINKELGTTILLTSHYMQEVEELCTRIAFINNGKIVDKGSVDEIKKRHKNLQKYFIKMVEEDED